MKNKTAPPFQGSIDIDFIYSHGPDQVLDLIEVAKKYDLIRFTKGAAKIRLTPGGHEETIDGIDDPVLKPAGAAGMYRFLTEQPKVFAELRKSILSIAIKKTESDEKPEPQLAEHADNVQGDEDDIV
jgi:hypothetical protein